jgi:hypothetical protein
VDVHASEGRICVLFELAGDVRTDTEFKFSISSPDFDWGRSGFSQGFEVDLRSDGRARVTSGRDDHDRPIAVPAEVGRAGNRLLMGMDASSFASGHPYPGSAAVARPIDRFDLQASLVLRVSAHRQLYDGLGPASPAERPVYSYP